MDTHSRKMGHQIGAADLTVVNVLYSPQPPPQPNAGQKPMALVQLDPDRIPPEIIPGSYVPGKGYVNTVILDARKLNVEGDLEKHVEDVSRAIEGLFEDRTICLLRRFYAGYGTFFG